MNYWLMKSEPDTYPLAKLKKDKKTWWTGVRNYQARNFMMNDMNIGDEVLFYHSNAEPPGIAGLAVVSGKAMPDELQFDKKSDYFEPRATREKPVWYCVEIKFKKEFKNFIPLDKIKSDSRLQSMAVIQKGQRLSIQPVSESDYEYLVSLGL